MYDAKNQERYLDEMIDGVIHCDSLPTKIIIVSAECSVMVTILAEQCYE